MSPRFPRRSTRPQVSTRLRITWLTLPSETPSQIARCSRGIIGWSVMMSSARFSAGLTPKAGAARAIRSGRGRDARFRSGDWVRGPPPGLLRETTAFSEKWLLPITHEVEHQRRRSRLSRAFLDSTATWQSRMFRSSQNLVVSLSSHTLGTRIRTAPGRRL